MTDWIHLTSGKEFSRLLYTNPVCLLSTVDISNEPSDDEVTIKNGVIETGLFLLLFLANGACVLAKNNKQ